MMYDLAVGCMHSVVSCGIAVLFIVPDPSSPCDSRIEVSFSIACFLILIGSLVMGIVARLIGNKENRSKYLIFVNAISGIAIATLAWVCVA